MALPERSLEKRPLVVAAPGVESHGPAPEVVARAHPLGDLEIQYFCRFGAEKLDDLGTRVQLIQAWGMCDRHALGFLAVEASLNDGWLFQPAVVYADLMERAELALARGWLFERARVAASLTAVEPCWPCHMGLASTYEADATAMDIVNDGRRLEPLLDIAAGTRAHWTLWVCGLCAESTSVVRCRPHLLAELDQGRVGLDAHRGCVADIARHADALAASFGWSRRGTETIVDRAALIGAVGWCAGWRRILDLLG